jgi:hypothetical protein
VASQEEFGVKLVIFLNPGPQPCDEWKVIQAQK